MGWAIGDVWRLLRGDELVGEIVIDSGDFPWLYGRFRPCPVFSEVKQLFDDELALLELAEDSDAHVQEWENAYDKISGSLHLVAPHGPVDEFILHIEGDQAWFRV